MISKLNNNNNCAIGTGTINCEGVAHSRQGVSHQALSGRHQLIDYDQNCCQTCNRKRKIMKKEKEANKMIVEYWPGWEPNKGGFMN